MKYELQKIGQPNPEHSDTPYLEIAHETAIAGRAITAVNAEIALLGASAPFLLAEQAFNLGGRRRTPIRNTFERLSERLTQTMDSTQSFYHKFADTNLIRGLLKGVFSGQLNAAEAALLGLEGGATAGALVGGIIGLIAGSPAAIVPGAIIGAKVAGVAYPAVVEFGVVRGVFDAIGARFGKEGALKRLGMRRVRRAASMAPQGQLAA